MLTEELTNNILMVVADSSDINQAKEKLKQRHMKQPGNKCFQTLVEFNCNRQRLNSSEENVWFETLETDSDDTLFTTAQLNISLTPAIQCKTTVDQILKDFCSSPLSPKSAALEEHIKLQPFYHSPSFKFKHKNIRTYSNKNRTNLLHKIQAEQLLSKNVKECEDGEIFSISTGLSVQEDLSQTEIENEYNRTSALNETQQIYENLLNLSSYFTQQIGDDNELEITNGNILENEQSNKQQATSNIDIEEEHAEIQQDDYNDESQKSIEELREKWLTVSKTSEGTNLIKEILDLRRRMPVNWKHLLDTLKSPQDEDCSGFVMIDAGNHHAEQNDYFRREKSTTIIKTCIEEADLFSDDECNDFFANFNSQEAIKLSIKTEKTDLRNLDNHNITEEILTFKTAGNKSINISDAARIHAAKLISNISYSLHPAGDIPVNLEDLQTEGYNQIQVSKAANNRFSKIIADVSDLPLNANEGFQTEGKKPSEVSAVAKDQASKIMTDVSQWPLGVAGFQTARNKPIKVSEEAKHRAAHIIAHVVESPFETIETNFEGYEKIFEKDMQISEPACMQEDVSDVPISDDIQDESFSDIQFSEWPHEEKISCSQYELPCSQDELPLPMLDVSQSISPNIVNIEDNVYSLSRNSSLNSSNSKLIARQNLLSLTKRRKQTSTKSDSTSEYNFIGNRREIVKVNNATSTIKTIQETKKSYDFVTEKCLTPDNRIKEQLVEMPVTSTPNSNENTCESATHDTFTSVKGNLKNKMCSNKKIFKTPTALERIGRLNMYGEPPDISPITDLTSNKCRPSGLRRTSRK